MKCPCGTDLALEACCGPIISGERAAPTAEALMRSRYSAYAQKNTQYVIDTHDPEGRADLDPEGTSDWAERTEWLKLDVLNTKAGGENDDTGEVEFVARFRDERGKEHSHHELSTFIRREGRWYYQDGATPEKTPITRATPKIGRNDTCPCGSGKKYKKCCGKIAA
jgi:SEC-C motif-containing protein